MLSAASHVALPHSSSASENPSDDEALPLGACLEQAAASLLLLSSAAARIDLDVHRTNVRAPGQFDDADEGGGDEYAY